MYYNYELTGDLFEDRETVQRALYSNKLTYDQKQELLESHNTGHIDAMTMDTYTNMLRYDIDLNRNY